MSRRSRLSPRRRSTLLRSSLPLVCGFLACGPVELADPGVERAGEALTEATLEPSDEINSAANHYENLFDTDPRVELRINKDGSALSEKLIPDLAWKNQTLVLPDTQLAFGWLPGLGPGFALQQCHTIDGRTWALTMKNVRVTPAVKSNDVLLHFATDKTVDVDVDLDDLVMTFDLEFFSAHDDNWYCNIFGSDYRASTGVTVQGMSGTMSATLGVPTAGSVKIDSITNFTAEVGTVTLTSDFLNTVAPWGLALYDLFGSGCGATINACVDLKAKEYLKDSTLKTDLKQAINDVLGPVAKVDTVQNLGLAAVDFTAALTAVTTSESKDRIRSQWDVDFSTNRPDGACAAGLAHASYFGTTNTQTTNDVDILIPYRKITDLMYTVGKTGDLCAPFLASGATFEVHPVGAFRLAPSFLNSFTLSLPVQIEGQLSAFASGSVSATLELTAVLEPRCSGMVLRFTGVNFANPTGTATVTIGGLTKTLSAKTFIANHKAAVEARILAFLQPPQVVAPGTFAIPGTGYALQYGQLLWGTNEVTFGFDVVSGACTP